MSRHAEQSMICPTCHGNETIPVDSPVFAEFTDERLLDVDEIEAESPSPEGERACPSCLRTGYVDPHDFD